MFFFIFISIQLEAQLYKPFTSFRVIKTEYFDIIFPSESESSARVLASYADSAYERLSLLFGITVPGRIPVTFAPHTEMFNGYYNPVPYPHITLYDTPMDLEWTNFENTLEALFIHELTHAVSLNTRSRFFRVLRNIFGNWATPSAINAPAFMIEGVTLTAESMTGFGRANDPLIKQKLRQAVYEDEFLAPFKASGVNDNPAQRGSWYDYGGIFSSWLIQTYGMDKYVELWQAMGKKIYFSFIVYRSGFYRIFKKVYDINFMDAWNAFKTSLSLDNIEENTDELLPDKNRFFSKKRNFISALAANEKYVYILNGSECKVHVFDTQTENIRTINIDLLSSYDLDVSADGKTLLVSGYHLTGERYGAAVTEFDTASGRKTGNSFRGLYKARYFRDGVIGIKAEAHNNRIVFEDFSGSGEVLFKGDEELIFSGPQAVDDQNIAFIAARKGMRVLMLYNYITGGLFQIENSEGGDHFSHLREAGQYWQYMRGLNVSEGKLFFSHNADDRMYKLAVIDLETMQAVFNERDFSGGVFYPLSANGGIYYRGAFFSGDGFLRFPEMPDSLSGAKIKLKLTEANHENYGLTAGQKNAEISLPEISPEDENTQLEPGEMPSKRFFGVSYMNPFKLWLPLFLFRFSLNTDNFNFSLDGGGIFSVIMDPTDRNLIIVTAFADIAYRMAMIERFSWQCTIPGFPVTLEFSDKVIADSGIAPYRSTKVFISGSLMRYPGRWGYGFSFGAGYFRNAFFNEEKNAGAVSAYEWEETSSAFVFTSGLTFSNLQRRQNELFGRGFYLSLKGSTALRIPTSEFSKPRIEGIFRANAEIRFPLSFTFYGAYDETGMNLHGLSFYGAPLFDAYSSKEYSSPGGFNLSWLTGGEMSAALFSFEIQRNLSHVYFNRFFGTLTLRNVLYNSEGLTGAEGIKLNDFRLAQSLILSLKFVISFLPIKAVPVFIEPHLWGAWKFSNTITGEGFPWGFGFGFNYRY